MENVFNLHPMMDMENGASPEVKKVMQMVQEMIAKGMDPKEAKAKGIELILAQTPSGSEEEEELEGHDATNSDAPGSEEGLKKVVAVVKEKQAATRKPTMPSSSYGM